MTTQLVKVFSYALSSGVEKVFPGGRFLRVITADAAIDITFYDESNQPIGQAVGVLGGFQIGIEPHDLDKASRLIGFAKVGITSATNQTITVAISRQPIQYDRLTGSISSTIASGTTLDSVADVSVNATTTTQVAAANANQKSVTIKNLSNNTAAFRIGDIGAGAANGHELNPGESITIETTAAVYGYNSHSGAQSVSVVSVQA